MKMSIKISQTIYGNAMDITKSYQCNDTIIATTWILQQIYIH